MKILKLNQKNDVKRAFNSFFKKNTDPTYAPKPKTYNSSFLNGDDKALEVISYLINKNAPLDRLAYLSIGGADGADVIKVLQNTDIKYGLLLEYDHDCCKQARHESKYLMEGKQLSVIEGDAFSNRKKINEILNKLYNSKLIDGVVITGFSVFHELPERSTGPGYDLRTFILQMIEGINQVYFYSKEPCSFTEWTGRVEISFPSLIDNETLYKFCLIVQQKLGNGNSQGFNQPIIKLKDCIELSSELATEVVKKIVYFLYDGDEDKLLYELQESHSKFSLNAFSTQVNNIFSANPKNFESEGTTRNETTNTFRRIYEASGIKIKSVNNVFVDTIAPNGFVTIRSFYRPLKQNKKNKVQYSPARTEKDAIYLFFKAIEVKKFEIAFTYLNNNLRSFRWNNDVNRFVDGYHNLIQQKLISISQSENNMGKGWLVYIQSELKVYTKDNNIIIEDIVRNGIGDFNLDIIKERVEMMENFVDKFHGNKENFLKIPLFRFLHPNYIDDIRWISNISDIDASKEFSKQKTTIHACYNVFCQEEDGKWEITKLSPINFNGLPLK